MNSIGGYFGLELRNGEHYHKSAIRLNTARNCFEYVLITRGYRKVFIPYYTCEVLLEPLKKLDVGFEFYHIDENLEPRDLPKLNDNEAFLYTNYFGLKQECVKRLVSEYGKQLIVDNAQSFYANPIEGIDTFFSARKFFGVPDGAYLYTDKPLHQEFEQDCSCGRMSHLLKRVDLGAEDGFYEFRKNDESLCNQDVKLMSRMTEAILSGIDYDWAKQKRRKNYGFLEKGLNATNMISLNLGDDDVPMVYPYLVEHGEALKKKLIESKVFVATYWPNVFEWCNSGEYEYILANRLIPLPIDQRYREVDLDRVVDLLC